MGSTPEEIAQAVKEAKELGLDQGVLDSLAGEGPRHRIRISKPFYLGKCEVSVGQFRRFAEATGYQTEAEKDGRGGAGLNTNTGQWEVRPDFTWRNPGFRQQDQHPVVVVSWNDVKSFCGWLSTQDSRTYRLPTEAEWEYACRAGTVTRYFGGDEPSSLQRVANVADVSLRSAVPSFAPPQGSGGWDDRFPFTAPSAQFAPNGFGLHDIHGNVWEWCQDWFGDGYYATSPLDEPTGPAGGSDRVGRGGCWGGDASRGRASDRRGHGPGHRDENLGFRLARAVSFPP